MGRWRLVGGFVLSLLLRIEDDRTIIVLLKKETV